MLQLDTKKAAHLAALRNDVKKKKPLVHCITNRVTMTDCANALLAIGAAPIMSEDRREVEEMVSIVQALVLNIGTLFPEQVESMILAGKKAKSLGIPVVFDPVGAGATALRNEVSARILEEVKPDIIRGNMSEIRALYGFAGATKGVEADISDAVTMDNAEKVSVIVKELARRHRCTVAATGAVDIISDGEEIIYTANGHEMLCRITGSGCMLSALTAGFAAVSNGDFLNATAAAFALMGVAGEEAQRLCAETETGTGTFHTALMDRLDLTDGNRLKANCRIFTD